MNKSSDIFVNNEFRGESVVKKLLVTQRGYKFYTFNGNQIYILVSSKVSYWNISQINQINTFAPLNIYFYISMLRYLFVVLIVIFNNMLIRICY